MLEIYIGLSATALGGFLCSVLDSQTELPAPPATSLWVGVHVLRLKMEIDTAGSTCTWHSSHLLCVSPGFYGSTTTARTYLFQPFLAVQRISPGHKQPLGLRLDGYSGNT